MKKLIKLLILSVAVVFFTGCNGTVDGELDGTANVNGSTSSNGSSYSSVNLLNLSYGYQINGYSTSNNITLEYCGSSFYYYRNGSTVDSGSFSIGNSGYRINMYVYNDPYSSSYTDSYRIDTSSGSLYNGSYYDIVGGDYFQVSSIVKIPC